MNEFEIYMDIRNNVDSLIQKLEDISDVKIKMDNIDYSIMMLNNLKKEQK